MEDPWKVFHPPSRDPPKLLPVSSNSKGKVLGFGAPQTIENGILGIKMVKNDSLPKSIEIINFRDFCENSSKTPITHQREARKFEL